MNHAVWLPGLDAALLSLETPGAPMNIVATRVLDPSSTSGGYGYERILRLVEEGLPRLAPLPRRQL